MKTTEFKTLLRESINEYIKEIDEAGNRAAVEAKMAKTQEAIELREKKMNMDGLDESYHDMMDKGRMKELGTEVKSLKKSLEKYTKQLEKLDSKSAPKVSEEKSEVVTEENPVEESDINMEVSENEEAPLENEEAPLEEAADEKTELSESFKRMKALAGIIKG